MKEDGRHARHFRSRLAARAGCPQPVQAERIDPRLIEVWPRETKPDRARFEKLKEAYVKARYSKHYRITEGELAWLGDRVGALGRVAEVICTERIEALERTAQAA